MEDLRERELVSFPWFRMFIISYGICILLSLAGVVLGAINFAAGPVHYPGYVLVLWLLADIVLFVAVALHLAYYGVEIWRMSDDGAGSVVLYGAFIGIPVIVAGIDSLANKHFGRFSGGALAILVVCGVIDVILVQRGK